MNRHFTQSFGQSARQHETRRGIVVVLTAFLLTVLFAFLALSVDTGRIVLTETKMQNACDAASLAASQQIAAAVYAAGQGQGSATIDGNSVAVTAARQMAFKVAQANGVYIDQNLDVKFGKRGYNSSSGTWSTQWGVSPFNTVKVTARRNGSDSTAQDGEFPLAFGWAVNKKSVPLLTTSTAFTESRDMVLVVDVSASMNDDSSLGSDLGATVADQLLDGMWNSLVTADPKWPNTSTSKFPSTGFGSVNSNAGTFVSSTNTSTILSTLGLNTNGTNGHRKFPFPQSGRGSNGLPNAKPSDSSSDALWTGYVNYVKGLSGTYAKKYGYRTLMDYLQDQRYDPSQSEDLWQTPHYPYQAVKDGATMFLNFLKDLGYGDEVGLVAYGQYAVVQTSCADTGADISSNPITSDYDTINSMQIHHQSGEYQGWTAMGDGIVKAMNMLVGDPAVAGDKGYARYGAQPTMIVMTDGQTNQKPSGWSLPAGFSWSKWTDYDGNGVADYTTSDNNKRYALYEATLAAQKGITIHTIGVGEDADSDLLKAIAFIGNGVFISVPGGTSVQQMQSQLEAGFSKIAAKVPASKLVDE